MSKKMRTGKKAISWIVMIAMMISLFPTAVFGATGQTSQQQIDGESSPMYYAIDKDGNINTEVEPTTDPVVKPVEEQGEATDRVVMSKSIKGTENENEFDITLKVSTKDEIQKLVLSPDAAVVLVLDVSQSMDDNSYPKRYEQAQQAAKDFVDAYAKDAGEAERWISVVEYASSAMTVQNWIDVNEKNQQNTNITAVKGKIDTVAPGFSYENASKQISYVKDSRQGGYYDYGDWERERYNNWEWTCKVCGAKGGKGDKPNNPHQHCTFPDCSQPQDTNHKHGEWYDGGSYTNIQAGLMLAQNLINARFPANNAVKASEPVKKPKTYVILLTDGQPKQYSVKDDNSWKNSTEFILGDKTNNTKATDGTKSAAASIRDAKTTLYSIAYATNEELLDDISHNVFKASDLDELLKSFAAIVEQIKKLAEAWTVTDPMGDRIDFISGEKVNEVNNYTENGYYRQYDTTTKTLHWNLKNEIVEPIKGVYTYQLTYRVRLNNLPINGQSFVATEENSDDEEVAKYYLTNKQTTLCYALFDEVTQKIPDVRYTDFLVPRVTGYTADFDFDKVAAHDNSLKLSDAQFELSTTGLTKHAASSSSEESLGKVEFTAIPSGHSYTLTETTAPQGYEKSNAQVKVEVKYGDIYIDGNKVKNYQFMDTLKEVPMKIDVTKTWIAPKGTDYPEATLTLEQSEVGTNKWEAFNAYEYTSGEGNNNKNVVNADGTLSIGKKSTETFTITVPKINPSTGKQYEYRVVEPDEIKGYDSAYAKINDEQDNPLSIINTITDAADMSVIVEKVWIQPAGMAQPNDVMITLLANGVAAEGVAPQKLEGNSVTFSNLPVYAANGSYITYSATDNLGGTYDIDSDSISSENHGTTANTITLTNKIKQADVTIRGEKIWKDTEETANRPRSITVQLLANDEPVNETTVTPDKDGVWKYEFTTDKNGEKLPKYEFAPNGTSVEEIVYTLQEITVDGYTSTIDGYNITNVRTDTTSLSGTKVWANDNDNALNTRPGTVEIILLANGSPALNSNEEPITQSIGNTDGAAFTFTDLPKYDQNGVEIVYSVTDEVTGYTPVYDAESTVLTNTYNNGEKITVAKIWQDGNNAEGTRLDKIIVQLFADNDDTGLTVTLNDDNNWTAAFENLPKTKQVPKQSTTDPGVGGDKGEGQTEPGEPELTLTGVEGGQGGGPSNEGEDPPVLAPVIEYENVPIVYTIQEVGADSGRITGKNDSQYEVSINEYTITNTLIGDVTYTVNKEWVGPKDVDKEDVEFAIGTMVNGEFTATATEPLPAGSTKLTFTVPAYENGQKINYVIQEILPDGTAYSSSKGEIIDNAITFTNTYEMQYEVINGSKIWNAPNNIARPASITVELYKNDVKIAEQTVSAPTEGDSWSFSFEEDTNGKQLPKYDVDEDGVYTLNTYTVKESGVADDGTITFGDETYIVTYGEGHSIINTIVGSRDIRVIKQWLDPGDKAHPEATFVLWRNGEPTEKFVSTEKGTSNQFDELVFEDLPIYDENGDPYIYTVVEQEVEGYTGQQKSREGAVQDILFVNVIDAEDVMISGEKHWADMPDGTEIPMPESIQLQVFRGTEAVGKPVTVTPDSEGRWTYSVPITAGKYDSAGQYVAYTVAELDANGQVVNDTVQYNDYSYDVSYGEVTRDEEGNLTADITNSFQTYKYQINRHYTHYINNVAQPVVDVMGDIQIGTAGEEITLTPDEIDAWTTVDNKADYKYVDGYAPVTLSEPTAEPYQINLYYELRESSTTPPNPPTPGGGGGEDPYYPPDDPYYPPTNIPDNKTPLTPVPPVVIPETEVPLAPAPAPEEVVIPAEAVPLSDNPKTGADKQQAAQAGLAALLMMAVAMLIHDLKRKPE